jgi:hypothetical protein
VGRLRGSGKRNGRTWAASQVSAQAVGFGGREQEQARRAADADDRSLSAWIRRAVEHELRRTA